MIEFGDSIWAELQSADIYCWNTFYNFTNEVDLIKFDSVEQ